MNKRFMEIKRILLKSQEYLLYLLIFLLPLQTRLMFKLGELNEGYYEYATMSLYGIDILLVVLLVFWLMNKRTIGSRVPKQVWWLIGGLELFIFISIFFALDWKLALYGYGRFLLGIGLFFLITQIKYNKIKLYWAIILSGAVQSFLAMWQFIAQSVYGSKWLGIATQYSADLGVSVVDNGFRRWLRAYGGLPHPNILGGFLVVCLLVGIMLYFNLNARMRKVDSEDKKKYEASILISWLFFITNFIGLLLTFSRSAWAGFLVGFVVLLVLETKKYKYAFIYLMKFTFVIIVVSLFFTWGLREPLSTRLNLDNRLEIKSVQERVNYNNEAWQIIKNNWLFGVGIKNYGLAVHDDIDDSRSVYEYEPVHNTFLLIWAETGIVGLLIFISLFVYLLINLLKNRHYGTTALIFAVTIMMIFDHWVWSLSFGVYLFWLVAGMAYKKI